MTDFEQTAATNILKNLPQEDDQFLRVQTQSTSKLDSWKDEDFARMKEEGAKMFDDNKDEIMAFIKNVMMEKFTK